MALNDIINFQMGVEINLDDNQIKSAAAEIQNMLKSSFSGKSGQIDLSKYFKLDKKQLSDMINDAAKAIESGGKRVFQGKKILTAFEVAKAQGLDKELTLSPDSLKKINELYSKSGEYTGHKGASTAYKDAIQYVNDYVDAALKVPTVEKSIREQVGTEKALAAAKRETARAEKEKQAASSAVDTSKIKQETQATQKNIEAIKEETAAKKENQAVQSSADTVADAQKKVSTEKEYTAAINEQTDALNRNAAAQKEKYGFSDKEAKTYFGAVSQQKDLRTLLQNTSIFRVGNDPTNFLGDYKTSGIDYFEKRIVSLIQQIDKFRNGKTFSLDFSEELDKTQKEAKELLATIKDVDSVEGFQKLGDDLIDLISNFSKLKAESKQALVPENTGVTKLMQDITRTMTQNTAMSAEMKAKYQSLFDTLANGTNISREELTKYIQEFQKLNIELMQSGQMGKSFFDTFKNHAVSLAAQTLAQYFSFQDIIRYGQQAYQVIEDLDTALVDLKKTTSMTPSQLEQFYYDANESAKELGVTTQDIIDSASSWSRLGYSDKEQSTRMAELSAKFASVSVDMTMEQADEGLVSIMKAYDVATEDVERQIMDNINTLGNQFALSNEDILEGMKRAGATLSLQGTSLEDSFALFTGAQEVIQNAERVGTALKTDFVFAYRNVRLARI